LKRTARRPVAEPSRYGRRRASSAELPPVNRQYVQHCVEHADWGAVDHPAALHASDAQLRTDAEGIRRRRGDDPTDRRIRPAAFTRPATGLRCPGLFACTRRTMAAPNFSQLSDGCRSLPRKSCRDSSDRDQARRQ
jgi:hypothetical protein